MESKIVEEFQNLQVIAAYDFFKMDELVHDLTNALEESSHSKNKGRAMDYSRKIKRRCKKRKSHSNPMMAWELGNMSEASESSIDEAIKDYMENIAQQSDSDDLLTAAHRLPSLVAMASNPVLSLAESDSVNENFSPMRPHRRRRRYKRMAVDPQNPRQVQELLDACGLSDHCTAYQDQLFGASEPDTLTNSGSTSESQQHMYRTLLGKRKRGLKERGSNSFDMDSMPEECCSQTGQNSIDASSHNMDANCVSESGTSSLSSNESDGLHTNDEARDGDDEQSDFFHEAGPVCGIPGIVPWLNNHSHEDDDSKQNDATFESILKGSFEHMSSTAKRNYQAKLMLASPSRPCRAARRRLKDIRSVYSLGCFIHDRQQWADHLKKLSSSRSTSTSNNTAKSYDPKRRKKTPPQFSPEEEVVGGKAEPIPETNIGSRILQTMGWNPGSGLGADGSGITMPILACRRPYRQGLGSSSSNQQ